MSGRVIAMFAVGLALMFAMWWTEYSHQLTETEKNTPIRGCADTPNCGGEVPICLVHDKLPAGVCTTNCASRDECPYRWCCHRLPGQSGPLRCLPPELCTKAE